ncbi:Cytochrome bo(3) ubiquinol oxidase subunit 2 precursor [compost metagenome]
MRFKYHGMDVADFDQWVKDAKKNGSTLDRAVYTELEQPSEREPVRHFGKVAPDLYHAVLNRCVAEGTVCMNKIMHEDANRMKVQAAARNFLRDEKTVLAEIDSAVCTPSTNLLKSN